MLAAFVDLSDSGVVATVSQPSHERIDKGLQPTGGCEGMHPQRRTQPKLPR